MKKYVLSVVLAMGFLGVFAQQEADSTLTTEEIQFRDSIAAINTNNALIQQIQESYNAATEAFSSTDYKTAITLFESVIALDSSNADAYFNKGLSNKELKNYAAAITDFETTFTINNSYFDAIFNQAKCYELLKDQEQAISTYDRLL
jgi:tetratricopeptide (TPR) repeat protein